MVPIVSFIGWHNSGKTTLATTVVGWLKQWGYQVAAVKSTRSRGLALDVPDSDTGRHRRAGAGPVLMVAPDQLVLQADNPGIGLQELACRYLMEADIIIAEGFKNERGIAKVEVVREPGQELRKQVGGVIAVASDLELATEPQFRLDQGEALARYLEERFLKESSRFRQPRTILLVNGRKVPLRPFIQEALAGSVTGFVETLKTVDEIAQIEVRIKR